LYTILKLGLFIVKKEIKLGKSMKGGTSSKKKRVLIEAFYAYEDLCTRLCGTVFG
jgi:hypothetical protein